MRKLRQRGMGPASMLVALIGVVACALSSTAAIAAPKQEIWISPTDNVTQHGIDFPDFFLHPDEWRRAASSVTRFSMPVRYFVVTPPEVSMKQLAILHQIGIPLDVSIPVMPVDKHVCGNGIEGTVWPGEPSDYSHKLKALGADVASFSLDLPLTSAHFAKGPQSCHLSPKEAAEHTARAIADVHAVYPNAKIIDAEVPTGMPASVWSAALAEWVDAYKQAAGRNFDGFMMDAWWQFDWRSAAQATLGVLGPRGIPVGIGITASGNTNAPAAQWVAASKKNACNLRASGIPVSYLGVANWQNMHVRGLPESDPDTLTGFVDWLASGGGC